MSLNRSVQKSHHSHPNPKSQATSPDYVGLVKFLMQPFLESPESLSVDCEITHSCKRVWIRIAFEGTDKGKVFGRGGRNIQAIRTVITAASQAAEQTVYLDIYGSTAGSREGLSFEEEAEERLPPPKPREKRGNGPKPVVKSRSL